MRNEENSRYFDTALTHKQYSYRGRSIGSEMTCHQLPNFNLCFDIGGAPLSATNIEHVFITHGHEDHIGGFLKHALRRDGRGLPPATYYASFNDVHCINAMWETQMKLSRWKGWNCLKTQALFPDDIVQLKNSMQIAVYATTHRIPTLGYCLQHRRQKLKEEFLSCDKAQISVLKEKGVEISAEKVFNEVSFPGDTNLNILKGPYSSFVTSAKFLILECTFIDEIVSPKEAETTGHIHIDDIVNVANDNVFKQNELVLLTHFSARYEPQYILDKVKEKLEDTPLHGKYKCLVSI